MSIIQTFFQGSDLFIDISTNRENLDLKNEIGETLYSSSQTKRVVIPSSVSVGSTVVSDAALKIPSGVGGSLYIDNYGSILGAGGSAASGNGGDAILVQSRCTIDNKPTGSIYAGGGGGGLGGLGGTGGQGSVTVITGSYPICTWSGRYGCYAYGTAYNYGTSYTSGGSGGSGGAGGRGRGYNQPLQSGTSGVAGAAGGTNAGQGGTGGTGGSGGDWGQPGSTGNSGNTGANGNYTNGLAGAFGVGGGVAGYYINDSQTYATLVNNGAVAGRVANPGYETLNFTASANLTVTGGGTNTVSIFKTSGGASWDNQAYSTTSFTAPCTIEFNKQADAGDNGASYAMIGWNEDPTTNASYDTLDYASYPYQTNGYIVYHNGSLINPGVTWSTTNKFYIVYSTDGFIKHYNGSTLLYSVNYGTGKTVYVDSSYYSVNGTYGGFSNIKVIKYAWNGTEYV